ncbi:phosphotransferase [Paenibacillus sp. H1-7]|uniref:AAA family ATPase n=1 Tax=Paenibacillus sp. H1-7 TaxID=2282849 RepID=UPI001EF815A6|nr:AAA family ATPase [Paenibacillus sp. H1-7]ULL13777.1 phosphotransferase [Paenibacillus sp. H1-7]
MERGIFLITGIMASGKSTVAELLSRQFDKSVHLRGDVYRKMIVQGREEMLPEASQEAVRQLELRYRLAASAADAYYDAGFTVVVQDVVIGPMLQQFVDYVGRAPLYVVVLAPDEETVALREAGRSKKGYGPWSVAGLNEILHMETPRLGLWLDTSKLTPEETVQEILRLAETEALVKA